MLRKILTSIVILVLLAFIVLGYLYFQKQKEYKGVDPFSAVPVNSEMIIQFESLEKLIANLENNTGAWKELSKFDKIDKINQNLAYIDSLVDQFDSDHSITLNRSLTMASHLQGKNDIEYLYILPVMDYLEKKKIQNSIINLVGPERSIQEKNYHDATVYSISSLDKNSKGIHFAFSKGLFLASRSILLLENSIRQVSTDNSISKLKGFEQIRRTIGKNVDANIFLNLKTFPKQISFSLNKKYSSFIRNYTNLANWSELDLNFRNRIVLLNGFTYSDPQQGNLMNLFLQQEPVKMEMESILPASTSMIAILGMNDPLLHKGKYRKFLDQMGQLSEYLKKINQIKKKTGSDIEEIIYSLIYNEVGLAFSANSSHDRFTIIRTKSASIAKEKLIKMILGFAKKQQRTLSYYKRTYHLDGETNFDIYRLPEDKIPEKLFGSFFTDASSAYFTFIDNYLVMGPSISALSAFIKESVLGKTLASNECYQENKEFLSNKANFYFYASTPKANHFVSSFLNTELQNEIKTHKESINKFQAVGLQLSSNRNLIYNNLFIEYDPVVELAPQTEWESRLDTNFLHKPFLVKNHYTKENEILIQDVNNLVYLINPEGRILWKKQLNSAIIGQVVQIDYFKNNKLQYLFATKNRLQLIDRNGNNVKNYPVRLKAEAARGISVFDYDKNRNYRIFIPCKNQKVYAYSKEGKLVKGWNPAKTENPINCEVQHFRVKNKDYIVYADKYRVYILNRKGQERVKLKEQFSKSENNPFYLEKQHTSIPAHLVTTDSSGTIYYCFFNGKVQKKTFTQLSGAHYFIADDLNADGKNEYLFADYNFLKVFNQDGKQILEKKFDSGISFRPNVYLFSRRNIEIGVCLQNENKIYLLDLKGNIHRGFPLKGNTEFSIGFSKTKDKSFNLYVGDNRNFLLNYTVQ
ncbi:DUF3352 domain-containing protein [Ancylomarina longa]|uniref:DUF3352 domain-containing protein n=1 Tax=Ancylomarina longa TaxID=2487017 RepID=A0A434AW74_9BACT|nr:DUF3352 domain-containing protein [Ancylomarina longa]RUT78734.1 hypothetical protein DLK05_06235 [Ancylomarina longa]